MGDGEQNGGSQREVTETQMKGKETQRGRGTGTHRESRQVEEEMLRGRNGHDAHMMGWHRHSGREEPRQGEEVRDRSGCREGPSGR